MQNITNTFRNIVPSMLFFRGMILSIIIYFIEVFTLKKMKYGDLSEIKFRNFYLPGNAIVTSFIIQGIAVSIYFIKKWIKEGIDGKLFIGAICVGIFGMTGVSFIGMIDSILDFRKVRVYKSI